MLQTEPKMTDRLFRLWGTVTDVAPGMVKIAGISQVAAFSMPPDTPRATMNRVAPMNRKCIDNSSMGSAKRVRMWWSTAPSAHPGR